MSKKYEKTWTMEDLPLTMVEMVWFGDVVKRGEILAHSFNNHYFISENQKVLLIDDLIATGGTARAAANLIEKLGGKIEEIAFVIELPDLKGREKLLNWPVFSIIGFEGD